MSEASPDSLLKSALEKIVYFEARSTQLANDLDAARADAERSRSELAQAGQREIELRRLVAELEVRLTRAHSEREDSARVSDAMRRERAELIGKMLDASRIHGAGLEVEGFDLAQFIATLRAEVLSLPPGSEDEKPARTVQDVARSLESQGRLSVSKVEMDTLEGASPFFGRSEETLFGFSVRELSAPDAASRARAAERLKALGHVAAAPALATALHVESEPAPLVAMLHALGAVAHAEAAPVVVPHLASKSPDVRIAALKALLTLDAVQAVPHMAAAMKDPDRAVRRRASMLALQLRGVPALELGSQGIRDGEGDVRALAALVLGASGNEAARPLLVTAMRDADQRVRNAASQALSRLIGHDVTALVGLEDRQRAREVRRLTQVEAKPVRASAQGIAARLEQLNPAPKAKAAAPVPVAEVEAPPVAPAAPVVLSAVAPQEKRALSAPAQVLAAAQATSRVAVVEEVEVAPAPLPPQALDTLLTELRSAIRGRSLDDLARGAGLHPDAALGACATLIQRGQVVRRGLKYFVA